MSGCSDTHSFDLRKCAQPSCSLPFRAHSRHVTTPSDQRSNSEQPAHRHAGAASRPTARGCRKREEDDVAHEKRPRYPSQATRIRRPEDGRAARPIRRWSRWGQAAEASVGVSRLPHPGARPSQALERLIVGNALWQRFDRCWSALRYVVCDGLAIAVGVLIDHPRQLDCSGWPTLLLCGATG